MTKEEKTAAIKAALQEHKENLAAVEAANVPNGFDGLVKGALSAALAEKLSRIFEIK